MMRFTLPFENGGLKNSSDGLQLIKEYNEIVSAKKHLVRLWYKHSRVNKKVKSADEIESLLRRVRTL